MWVPDNSDALAAVEKRVDAPTETPELLVELSDGTLRGSGSREETCVASTPSHERGHPSEATQGAAGTPRSGITARQLEERRKRETEPGWSKRASVDTWQELRAHLATCWSVPAETVGSSVVLRFMINAVGELRGPPMITATNVVPKDMSARYRETALAVLQKCLPVRPTPEFGAIVHDTVLHLRLVNGAPFPSRNLGPWMTVFARPNRGG